jgi:hypothetical protein
MATLRKWFTLRMFRRRPAEVIVNMPNDSPTNVAQILSTISHIIKSAGVSWCVVGDLLLAHYLVKQNTRVCFQPVFLQTIFDLIYL